MTHDQIDRLVRRANPLPDPSVLAPVDAPVLTTERRTEMQTDRRDVTEERGQSRWRGPLVGVTVAAAILIAGGIFLMTRNENQAAEPAPNATPIDPDVRTPLAPGAYFADPDGDESTRFGGTLVVGSRGWTSSEGGVERNGVSLHLHHVNEPFSPTCGDISDGAMMATGSTAADLANGFNAEGFIVREAPAPVSAFGLNGYHVVVEVPQGSSCAGWQWNIFLNGGDVFEAWLFDSHEGIVMVEAMWTTESAEEDVTELRTVLDTLVITP
jgi:hypothetical protein